jgi:phosphoribosylamine--glycine ligase
MKFLLYSECGEGAEMLHRIAMEGNDCAIFIRDKIYSTVFNGILPHVDNPDVFVDKETVIIFDMSGNGKVADTYRRKGHFVYGSSSFSDDLENDRDFGFESMEKAGIKIPEHTEFKDFNKGIEFVRQSNERLVFKPSGCMPCKLTYCAHNSEELMCYMKFVEKHFGKDIDSFILQEFIEGIVVSSEFFCDGNKFVHPANHTVEVKKSMNDELGPSTGCSGNIAWICDNDRIVSEGVARIEELCKKNQFVGQIDLNVVANEEGVYGLEWTPRMGYDATPTLLSLLEVDFGQFFSDLVRGDLKELPLSASFAGGIRVSIPPYPAEPKKGVDTEEVSPNIGVPIQNYEDYDGNFYWYEVEKSEDGELVHSGGTGVIACVIGQGDTPEKSLEEPEKILEDLILPDKQYRTDLQSVLSKMINEVYDNG